MVVRKMAMPETDADAGAKGAGVSIIAPLTEGYEIVTAEVRALTERLAREANVLPCGVPVIRLYSGVNV